MQLGGRGSLVAGISHEDVHAPSCQCGFSVETEWKWDPLFLPGGTNDGATKGSRSSSNSSRNIRTIPRLLPVHTRATLPRQYHESTVPISKYILTSPLSSQEKHEYHHRAVGQTASPGVMDVRNIL